MFFIFVGMCAISCSGFLFCRSVFIKGGEKMLDSADVLYDLTIELEDSGDDLMHSGILVINATLLAIPTCPDATVIFNYTEIYLDSVAEYNDIIDPIPGNINDLRQFSENGNENIQIGIWLLWCIFITVCFFNILAFCLRKRVMMRVTLGLGIVLLYGTLGAWLGATVMLVSCMRLWLLCLCDVRK
jgi:hypothetical protein